MPLLYINILNSEFGARDDGADYDTAEAALASGQISALAVAADEIRNGRSNSAVEISVEQNDGTAVLRSVIAISVSPLLAQTAGSED